LLSCSKAEKHKHSSIPSKAIWIGGVDGGCWVAFTSLTDNSFKATIFYEDGKIWEKGLFKKKGNCNVNRYNIIEKIIAFDGVDFATYENCFFSKK